MTRIDAAVWFVIVVATGAWIAFHAGLGLVRHASLETHAFDLGYITQTLAFTASGEFFRMPLLEGGATYPEGLDPSIFRRPHSYLAFHVEPILLLYAPFFAIWPDPRALIIAQALGIGLGAIPAALLGQRWLGTAGSLALGLGWLLAPALQGAVLSDFHAVALGATWLALGLWALDVGRDRLAAGALLAVAASREDASLVVGAILVAAALGARGRRRVSLIVGGASAFAWTILCFRAIMPYYNGGTTLFWSRYTWLGETPRAALVDLLADPTRLLGWFGREGVAEYLTTLALTAGGVGLLAPLTVLPAIPLALMNALSSFDWMRSGGAHYSAIVVPVLLRAAAHGGAVLPVRPALASAAIAAAMLAAHLWIGIGPWKPGFAWPGPTDREAAIVAALAAWPRDQVTSASSPLVPHLPAREARWFPAGDDGPLIAVDALSALHPLEPSEARAAIEERVGRGFGIVVARGGLLVLARGHVGGLALDDLGADFAGAAMVDGGAVPGALARPIRFGDAIDLVGATIRRRSRVGLLGDQMTLVTVWRLPRPLTSDLRFTLATTAHPRGGLLGLRSDAAALPIWWPTSRWPTGRPIALDMPLDAATGRIDEIGVAVREGAGPWLMPDAPVAWEGGTIARVASARPAR